MLKYIVTSLLIGATSAAYAVNTADGIEIPQSLKDIDDLSMHVARMSPEANPQQREGAIWSLYFKTYEFSKKQKEDFERTSQEQQRQFSSEKAQADAEAKERERKHQTEFNKQADALRDRNSQLAAATKRSRRLIMGQIGAIATIVTGATWSISRSMRLARKAQEALQEDPLINWRSDMNMKQFAALSNDELITGAMRVYYKDLGLAPASASLQTLINALDERIQLLNHLISWEKSWIVRITTEEIELAKERLTRLHILREQIGSLAH